MALLASCWLLTEIFIIPNGFVKWFFLSFYINPFFLFFCQIFLWLKEFQKFLCFLFGISCFISSFIITFIKRVACILVSLTRPTKLEVFYEVMDHENPLINGEIIVRSTCVSSFKVRSSDSIVCMWHDSSEKVEEKDGYEKCKNSWLHEYLTSSHYNSPPFSNEPDMDSYQSQSSTMSPSGSFMDQELHCKMESFDEFIDTCPQAFEGIISTPEVLLPQFAEIQPFEDIVDNTMDLLPQSTEIQELVTWMNPHPSSSPAKSLESTHDFILSSMLNGSCVNEEFTRGLEDLEIICSTANDQVDNEHLLAVCRSDSPILSFEQPLVGIRLGGNGDSFHHMYTQRMRFFDVLYQERLYGINAIWEGDLASPRSLTSIESQISSRVQTKTLLKSLESDLELVYMAELCLTWEALHYQYRKVESQFSGHFCTDVSEKFRKFEILFERFMEDQKLSQGETNPSYTYNKRCQLQVPDVTGYMEDDNCDLRREGIKANEALEAIEKCIKSFWTYVKTDYNKSLWKFKATLWSHPTVEDPKDLLLLYDLTKALHKKEQVVKDWQKKKQSLLKRRVKPVQAECESIDVLCCAIDLKLVEKVLKMPIVSTPHLKWCQEKLNNIELRDGQLCRDTGASLFPLS